MANPNPQHNPTDGLGVAAYVTVSGSSGNSVIANSNGGANKSMGTPGNGQGIGPGTAASGTFPVAQYSLTLSVGSNGGYVASLVALAVMKDVQNNAYTPVNSITTKSYNNPSAGSPSWYRPSNFAGYSADVVAVSDTASISVGSESFVITALNPGQGIVEVQFPTFDNTNGDAGNEQENPIDMIYVQIVVTVIP